MEDLAVVATETSHTTVVQPQFIVVKEDPFWKVTKTDAPKEHFIPVSNEEPELEIPLSSVEEFGEDPLLLPCNEDVKHFPRAEYSPDEEVRRIFSEGRSLSIKKEEMRIYFHERGLGKVAKQPAQAQEDQQRPTVDKEEKNRKQYVRPDKGRYSLRNKRSELKRYSPVELLSRDEGKREVKEELGQETKLQAQEDQQRPSIDDKEEKDRKQHVTPDKGRYSLRNKRSVLKRYSPVEILRINRKRDKSKRYSPIDEIPKVDSRSDTPVIINKNILPRRSEQKRINFNVIQRVDHKYKEIKKILEHRPRNSIDLNIHRDRERLRRSGLAEGFQTLLSSFPSFYKSSITFGKINILNVANECVTDLQKREQYLGKVVKLLTKKRNRLRSKVIALRTRLVFLTKKSSQIKYRRR